MTIGARNELNSIKRELQSIITELESISYGVKNDFSGIGNDICADSIGNVVDQYRTIQRKLNNMNTSRVTETFLLKHGGGGTLI